MSPCHLEQDVNYARGPHLSRWKEENGAKPTFWDNACKQMKAMLADFVVWMDRTRRR